MGIFNKSLLDLFIYLVFKLQDTATRIRSERIYPRASEINRIGTCEVEDEREFV